MKKFAKILALAVCAASAISLSACSGCGGTVTYTTTTSPNWQIRGSAADELDSSSVLLTNKEVATYSISFNGGSNSSYSLEYYDGGTYTTTFYATSYDWGSENIPAEYRQEGQSDYVYVYETQLTLSGAFVMGENRHEFTNTINTVSYFRSAANNLVPVYSRQDIKCTSPNSLQPGTLEVAYVEMDRAYETYYNRDGSAASVTLTARDDEESGTAAASTATEYTLIDSSAMGIALRSMTQSGTHAFDVFVPVNGASARYQAMWGSSAEISREDVNYAQIVSAMDDAAESGYILTGLTDGVRKYSWTPVTVSLVSDMTGPSTTYYCASVTNTDMNASRAALMRIEEVVPFNLGTIIYNLSSLTLEAIS